MHARFCKENIMRIQLSLRALPLPQTDDLHSSKRAIQLEGEKRIATVSVMHCKNASRSEQKVPASHDYFVNLIIVLQECTHSPLTIFPTPIPKNHFEELKRIQPHINKLMYLASQDHEFLVQSLRRSLFVIWF